MKSTHSSQYRHFLAALRGVRKKLGISQQELADRLKRPQSFVSKYEMGERRLDVVEFIEVMIALQSNPAKFIAIFTQTLPPTSAWGLPATRERKRKRKEA